MKRPKSCHAYYYGGLPVKGPRRKGRLWNEGDHLFFEVPEEKGNERIDLKIPFAQMDKIFLTQDNNYGSDTVLFNLAFRDEKGRPFTLRFAPIAIIPRRRWPCRRNGLHTSRRRFRSIPFHREGCRGL